MPNTFLIWQATLTEPDLVTIGDGCALDAKCILSPFCADGGDELGPARNHGQAHADPGAAHPPLEKRQAARHRGRGGTGQFSFALDRLDPCNISSELSEIAGSVEPLGGGVHRQAEQLLNQLTQLMRQLLLAHLSVFRCLGHRLIAVCRNRRCK